MLSMKSVETLQFVFSFGTWKILEKRTRLIFFNMENLMEKKQKIE